jgi:peptidoglycan hydrolase CwlO-like protein
VWLEISLEADRSIRLERPIVGGGFKLHETDKPARTLASRHEPTNPANVSTFLLSEMGAAGRKLSLDTVGTHGNLSFRDFASIVLTNELAIQSENSPVESGDHNTQTRERNVLKFILTGEDDSAIVPIVKPKDFRTGRAAKAAILQDMIDQINSDLSKEFPDAESLAEQGERIDESLDRIANEMAAARSSIRTLLEEKRCLSSDISAAERRSVEVALSLDSFEQLEEVYASDIARLESIEEAGFLLGLDGKSDCPVCGAPPESQAHSHGLTEVEDVRVAAEIEIQKIRLQRDDLIKTVEDTKGEAERLVTSIAELRGSLADVEARLAEATPGVDEQQQKLSDVVSVRDHVRRGLDLLARRDSLVKQKEDIEASKPPKRSEPLQHGLSTETAKAFAEVVSDVLLAWGFPGQKQVFFDLSTHDLIIDGKERRNNGKGVRAITHAAFKVALLLFCRERNLPHPGFLVLDTPLLTYRDPMKKPGDRLTPEEQELRNTDLKERFFEHLGHLGANAQFIVFENVDPPKDIETYALVQAFTNDPDEGRQGLL